MADNPITVCRSEVRAAGIGNMDKETILRYFAEIDGKLGQPSELLVYGSAAFMLLDEDGRTSLDIDVAGPYCRLDYGEFCRASSEAGLEVNPEFAAQNDHVEWVSGVRLCLAPPELAGTIVLWQGRHLVVRTVSPADLVASKLIRYDATEQCDVRYLVAQMRIGFDAIAQAAGRLPPPFREDALVRDNLENLRQDMDLWRGDS
jgi:hypothetical protein